MRKANRTLNNEKKLKIIFISFLILFLNPNISLAGQFKVTHVYDGDTIRAKGHDIEIKVRLVGIDAPEISNKKGRSGQPYSQESKDHLANLVLNKTVDIRGYGADKYNQVLGIIYLDGRNINLEMLKAGLAEVYQGKPPGGFDLEPYLKAEAKAIVERIGVWFLYAPG